MGHTIALDRDGWKKAGVDAATLPLMPDAPDGELRSGPIPMLQFGAFKLPQLPGVYGAPIARVERELDINIDGAVGAGLLASFRLTFSDQGRVLWVEQRPPSAPPQQLGPPTGLQKPGQGSDKSPLIPGSIIPGSGVLAPEVPTLPEKKPKP